MSCSGYTTYACVGGTCMMRLFSVETRPGVMQWLYYICMCRPYLHDEVTHQNIYCSCCLNVNNIAIEFSLVK